MVLKSRKKDSDMYGLHFKNENSNAKKILLTVDLSVDVIHYAIKNNFGLIISRYGLVSNPIKSFSDILVKKLFLLSKFPISIFTLGESYFTAKDGICDTIIDKLFLTNAEIFSINDEFGKNFPIGQICCLQLYPNQTTEFFRLKQLIQRAIDNLQSSYITYIGELENNIKKVAIVRTECANFNALIKLNKLNVDCLITMGMLGQYETLFCKDLKLSVVSLTIFDCVNKALEKLTNILSLEFPRQEFYLYNSKNPYKLAIIENHTLHNPELEFSLCNSKDPRKLANIENKALHNPELELKKNSKQV